MRHPAEIPWLVVAVVVTVVGAFGSIALLVGGVRLEGMLTQVALLAAGAPVVIGHEVGHLAAGHVAYWRVLGTTLFAAIPVLGSFLSRAQEYTADNYGYEFCPQGAPGAIATLAAGKYLNHEVRPDEYADRAVTDHSIYVWAANLMSSHPILIWRSHALRHRDRPGRMFLPPREGVVGSAAVPVATSATAQWADPAQALAFLDAHRQPGEDVFGGVRVVRRDETTHPTPMLDGSVDPDGEPTSERAG